MINFTFIKYDYQITKNLNGPCVTLSYLNCKMQYVIKKLVNLCI